MTGSAPAPIERIERTIVVLRGWKVMLDADHAALYGTTTKRLHEQVRRNRERFPRTSRFNSRAPKSKR